MKLLGFEIKIDSDVKEDEFLYTVSTVMCNPNISVEEGIILINMYIDGQINWVEACKYASPRGDEAIGKDQLFAHLDCWQEAVGPFSEYDMLYFHSVPASKEYQSKPKDKNI